MTPCILITNIIIGPTHASSHRERLTARLSPKPRSLGHTDKKIIFRHCNGKGSRPSPGQLFLPCWARAPPLTLESVVTVWKPLQLLPNVAAAPWCVCACTCLPHCASVSWRASRWQIRVCTCFCRIFDQEGEQSSRLIS